MSIEGRPQKSANGLQAPSLEQRIGAALTADAMASDDLSALLTEVGVAIAAADEFDVDSRFCGFEFVDAESRRSRWGTRLPCLDLRWPLRKKYDKGAGRIMLRDFRRHYFGKHKRLTKERCEEFFSNDANFIDV